MLLVYEYDNLINYIYHLNLFYLLLGPAILELSKKLNVEKADFSSVFTFRGTGYMTGCWLGGFFEGINYISTLIFCFFLLY